MKFIVSRAYSVHETRIPMDYLTTILLFGGPVLAALSVIFIVEKLDERRRVRRTFE